MTTEDKTISITTPFHNGELMVQDKLGVKEAVAKYAPRMIRSFMLDQHRELFEKLPFVVIGGLDKLGNVWATIMAGNSGFVTTADETQLLVNAGLFTGDPLEDGLLTDSKVGFLGIETTTRRRNRMNGRVSVKTEDQLGIRVEQSFGNCPQYIQKREIGMTRGDQAVVNCVKTETLSAPARQVIETADTFFIASRTHEMNEEASTGLDVSHRGGLPGFIEILDDNTIRFPDYAGNRVYNTLGNIVDDGRVGLVFVDYDNDALLYISGIAKIIWDDEISGHGPEVERIIELKIRETVHNFGAVHFNEQLIERSPVFRRFAG
jgi:predicted pyridoxine 5'-phosphate oxidase superfamily flavin-nucleotide-binding protein